MIYYSKCLLFPSSDAAVGLGEEAQPPQKSERKQERTREARFKFTYTDGKGGACSHIRLEESRQSFSCAAQKTPSPFCPLQIHAAWPKLTAAIGLFLCN